MHGLRRVKEKMGVLCTDGRDTARLFDFIHNRGVELDKKLAVMTMAEFGIDEEEKK